MLMEQANKFNKPKRNKEGNRKKKLVYEEEIEEESLQENEENASDDDVNLDDEMADFCEEKEFMNSLNTNPKSLKTEDWILVKFYTKKLSKFYVGQVTELEASLQAKFARHLDVSIITVDQIHLYLPPPAIYKKGHLQFNITFD